MNTIGVRDVYDDARGLIMELQRGKSVDQKIINSSTTCLCS